MPAIRRNSLQLQSMVMLFCKPATKKETVYEQFPGSCQGISFRSFDLKKDIPVIHQWVNSEYSKEFWQLDQSKEKLHELYKSVLQNPNAHSFIGLFDNKRICQIDLYRVQADELGKHLSVHFNDCGMHLLMAPLQKPISGLSRKIMEAFLKYYFSFSHAECMYAEPDIHNHKACRLLERSGFIFQQNIMLLSKAASLYLMTRKQFYEAYPNH